MKNQRQTSASLSMVLFLLILNMMFPFSSLAAGSAGVDICLAKWIDAYREEERRLKGIDDPDLIGMPQIEEWQAQCRAGKQPEIASPVRMSRDLLACSPSEAQSKSLAICAAAIGSCSAASSLAADSQRGFLQGQACDALVAQITGQKYDIADFLGSAVLSGLNSAADESLKRGEDVVTAAVIKLFVAGTKLYQFSTCVESAKAMCSTRYNSSDANLAGTDGDPIRDLINAYYAALTSGDARLAARMRSDAINNKFLALFSRAKHLYKVNDITILNCDSIECNVAADILATDKTGDNHERWLVRIKTQESDGGAWQISQITGSDLYSQLGTLVTSYYSALSSGDSRSAKSMWLAPPQVLDRIISTKFFYSPTAWVTSATQISAELKLEVKVKDKSSDGFQQKWIGKALAVNYDGRWKFTGMALTQSNLQQ